MISAFFLAESTQIKLSIVSVFECSVIEILKANKLLTIKVD